MKTIIHVHQQVIARNRKHGTNEPPLTVKTYKSRRRAHAVEILGPCKILHSPHEPLPCGARVWIETESEVICEGGDNLGWQAPEAATPRQGYGPCGRNCQNSH
jgi:hypothetical protein